MVKWVVCEHHFDWENFRHVRALLNHYCVLYDALKEKLNTYVGSLLWNETLVAATYQSNLDLRRWISENHFNMRPLDDFGEKEIEERQELLFSLFSKIWNIAK